MLKQKVPRSIRGKVILKMARTSFLFSIPTSFPRRRRNHRSTPRFAFFINCIRLVIPYTFVSSINDSSNLVAEWLTPLLLCNTGYAVETEGFSFKSGSVDSAHYWFVFYVKSLLLLYCDVVTVCPSPTVATIVSSPVSCDDRHIDVERSKQTLPNPFCFFDAHLRYQSGGCYEPQRTPHSQIFQRALH